MGRACGTRGTEELRMHSLVGENLNERESLEELTLDGIMQLEVLQEMAVCGLS